MGQSILIADDHAMVRDGLRPFLVSVGEDMQVLEAGTLDDAIVQSQKSPELSLAILDLNMPGMKGFDGLSRFREQCPDVAVVILSANFSKSEILSAMDLGAMGYLPKTMTGSSITNAIKLILSGERYLPSVLINADSVQNDSEISAATSQNILTTILRKLTDREKEVLDLLVDGKSNKQIANTLSIGEITVKIHVRHIYRKMGVKTRAQAVRVVFEPGWNN
jgi:two-component system nitrate/nitrite response regulator NarL